MGLNQILKELRMWRQETELPTWQHGGELQKSFEIGTWLRAASDRAIPEEEIFTDRAWTAILTEIVTALTPYLGIESEVLMEELIYHRRQAR